MTSMTASCMRVFEGGVRDGRATRRAGGLCRVAQSSRGTRVSASHGDEAGRLAHPSFQFSAHRLRTRPDIHPSHSLPAIISFRPERLPRDWCQPMTAPLRDKRPAKDDPTIAERLRAHRMLSVAPQAELDWMIERGTLGYFCRAIDVVSKGEPVNTLYFILKGRVAHLADVGGTWRKVMDWRDGDATGVYPYSRITVVAGQFGGRRADRNDVRRPRGHGPDAGDVSARDRRARARDGRPRAHVQETISKARRWPRWAASPPGSRTS